MGSFNRDFKNYEYYTDGDYYKKTVSNGIVDELAELFASECCNGSDHETVCRMVSVVNDLLVIAGKKDTTNWDIGILRSEIKAALHILRELKFDRFMDGTRKAAERIIGEIENQNKIEFLHKLNNVFVDSSFGYTLHQNAMEADSLIWEARWKATAGVSAFTSATESLDDSFPEALEHIQQAKDHLLNSDIPRSRKDSVRDSMSAMEAMLKKLASKNDIKESIKKLRNEGCWGLDPIVKDGLSIWDHLHRHYPDIRHGQQRCSDIDLNEALYWIGRIAVYIKYMADRKKTIER